MLEFKQMIPASKIWRNAQDYTDRGKINGLMRGYNIEIIKNGKTEWMSAEWIYGSPEEVFDDEYHRWSRNELGLAITGRICFRGYGEEHYDPIERESYVTIVPDEQIKNLLVEEISEMKEGKLC